MRNEKPQKQRMIQCEVPKSSQMMIIETLSVNSTLPKSSQMMVIVTLSITLEHWNSQQQWSRQRHTDIQQDNCFGGLKYACVSRHPLDPLPLSLASPPPSKNGHLLANIYHWTYIIFNFFHSGCEYHSNSQQQHQCCKYRCWDVQTSNCSLLCHMFQTTVQNSMVYWWHTSW